MKRIYFGGKNAIGNKAPFPGMTALRDSLTAECVAWICIAVFIMFSWTALTVIVTVGIGERMLE